MSEKNENLNVEESVEMEEKGFLSKVKEGLKKHGKKIVVGAAITTVGLIGYKIGSKNNVEVSNDLLDEVISDVDEFTEN